MLSTKRARGLVILFVVAAVAVSSLIGVAWATSQADRQAQRQAAALNVALRGVKPYQLLSDSGESLRKTVNLVSFYGDPNHVVIQVQPRSLLHIRCVVANLDAAGHYDIEIRHSGCAGG